MNGIQNAVSTERLLNKKADSSYSINLLKNHHDVTGQGGGDDLKNPLELSTAPAGHYKPMTVHELYEEILTILLGNRNEGCQIDDVPNELIEYIRAVFEVPERKHLETLKRLENRKPSQKTLSVIVDRAENLSSMDSNGLSDPFITLYIESNFMIRYNTTVAPSTLNPTWKQHFLIPIHRNPATDVLVVEAWDFDAAESVGEKMGKINEIKGIRGFKKLLKEIAFTASTGKHDNELIGRTQIPLKSIPVTGTKSWFTFKKNSNNKSRGSILLHLHFSTEKDKLIAINEHQNLLRILLLHELKLKNPPPLTWCGPTDAIAGTVIQQHSIQSNLSEIDCVLCEWEVYTKVHQTYLLSLKLFNGLLNKIITGNKELHESCPNQFWEGYKRVLPICFTIVRSTRSAKFERMFGAENLGLALEIIRKVDVLGGSPEFDLFPTYAYTWLKKTDNENPLSADTVLRETIRVSALQFLNKVMESANSSTSESDLQHLIVILRSIIYDLQMALERYDKHFFIKSELRYTETLYLLYQEKVAALFYPKIKDATNNLSQLNILDDEIVGAPNSNDFETGTVLFDLYLSLKRFANLGTALCRPGTSLAINDFYDWFYPVVANWLNISVIKTLIRIEKAIELDELLPNGNTMKYTSSALDTLSLFYQIKYFWEQLEWPRVDEAYTFAAKIVNDICRCCLFYTSKLSQRTNKIIVRDYLKQGSQCLELFSCAVNDINYLKEGLPAFIKELKVDDIIKSMAKSRSSMEADRCSTTIDNIICNTVEIIESEMVELIETVLNILLKIIRKLLEEGCEIHYGNTERMDMLLSDFQKLADILHSELQRDVSARLRDMASSQLSVIIDEIIQREVEKYRQASVFASTLRILKIILQILNIDSNSSQSLSNTFNTLKLHAMETEELIHQYYEKQLESQAATKDNRYGQLTVKSSISNNVLHLHILNAYQLIPMEAESSCNSYVKVHLTPPQDFLGIQSVRTGAQHKTRCPLYEEHFFIKLNPEPSAAENTILVFCVKNKDIFGFTNHNIAECYLSLADIRKMNNKQLRLNLRKPQLTDTEVIQILSSRTGDKLAKEFLRKLKRKCSN